MGITCIIFALQLNFYSLIKNKPEMATKNKSVVGSDKPKKTITAQHGKFENLAAKAPSAQKTEADAATKTKTKSKAKKVADKENVKAAGKAAKKDAVERESKYLYPAGMDNKQKKEFRRKARATGEAFLKELKTLKKDTTPKGVTAYEAKRKEYRKWKKETYAKTDEATAE